MDEGEELPVIQRVACLFEARLQRIGEGQVHVVAAEQDVLADSDAMQFKLLR